MRYPILTHFACDKGEDGHSSTRSSRNRSTASADDVYIGKYKLIKTIGKGNFAKVKLAKHLPTSREVRLLVCLYSEYVDLNCVYENVGWYCNRNFVHEVIGSQCKSCCMSSMFFHRYHFRNKSCTFFVVNEYCQQPFGSTNLWEGSKLLIYNYIISLLKMSISNDIDFTTATSGYQFIIFFTLLVFVWNLAQSLVFKIH